MSSNNMMAFMYGGLYTKGVKNINGVPANFGSGGDPFNEEQNEYEKFV